MKYDNAKYRIGMIVEHELRPKLGRGKIMRVEGHTLTVHFEQFGRMDIDGSITPIKIVCANDINSDADYFERPNRICSFQGVHEPSTPCSADIDIDVSYFENPDSLYSLEQLIKTPPPRSSGVYGWYFKELPPYVPKDGCIFIKTGSWPFRTKWWLLYLGQAKNLRNRVLDCHTKGAHYPEGTMSSFILSIACLLSRKFDLILHYPPESFGKGEEKMLRWLSKNVRVAWIEIKEEYLDTGELAAIEKYTLPLNYKDNQHPLKDALSKLRSDFKRIAKREESRKKDFKKAYEEFVTACKELGIKR